MNIVEVAILFLILFGVPLGGLAWILINRPAHLSFERMNERLLRDYAESVGYKQHCIENGIRAAKDHLPEYKFDAFASEYHYQLHSLGKKVDEAFCIAMKKARKCSGPKRG